jgi:nucleotide-binding universal stress UspA family protein
VVVGIDGSDESAAALHWAVGYARRIGALVLGNHGRGAFSSALVGSVAQRCSQRSACPVVLVPRSAEQPS